ncbi:MAG TPA: Fur family transcriptional regulator [Chloroflexota bacterium]|nr:Fur family transcriptional regulator [Chloroflexota bacterium]
MPRTSESAVDLLHAAGLRVTPQRQLLVEVARGMPGHFTAKEVHARIAQTYPGISVVSVYRGLETLRELGLVTRTNLGGMLERYEWISQGRHHHLICLSCGGQQELADQVMDGLREHLVRQYGFHASIDHFALFGLCKGCAAQHGEEAGGE